MTSLLAYSLRSSRLSPLVTPISTYTSHKIHTSSLLADRGSKSSAKQKQKRRVEGNSIARHENRTKVSPQGQSGKNKRVKSAAAKEVSTSKSSELIELSQKSRKGGGARRETNKQSSRGKALEGRSGTKRQPTFEREVLPHTESSLLANNVSKFSSVPLHPGLVESLAQHLGENTGPTDIQKLSLSHFFKRNPGSNDPSPITQRSPSSSTTLLASQTGSGKSIAYLLPVLHSVKWAELKTTEEDGSTSSRQLWSPKGLILAPTHELARQLSKFAKGLCHNIKLRVLCLSQENKGLSKVGLQDMDLSHLPLQNNATEFELHRSDIAIQSSIKQDRPIDILVGTTARVLDLARGRDWRDEIEKVMERNPWEKETSKEKLGRVNPPGWAPSLDLSHVNWVVMDEADVVYGSDFIHSTEMLLNDIAAAKQGRPPSKAGQGPPSPKSQLPFNLILCSATIPRSLDQYITTHYPNTERLTSIRLHNLPRAITPEHVPYTGGNKAADIASRLRSVWAEEAMENRGDSAPSKVLIFCNKSSRVDGLATYLTENGIPAIPLIRDLQKGNRAKHNDKLIEPFLKSPEGSSQFRGARQTTEPEPRVLVTTSLLSRGLDFNSSVKHVFIVDEPRSMVDFIHRAGRTGRAGHSGKVVLFSKSSGRGSSRSRTGVRGAIMKKIGLKPTKMIRRPADAFSY
ncbi:P-loop containing nucleoside triphosphate hydrolase protein [Serendipita vermifera]|nr:P-loop containing nucleoside triphosphate hydrolase protein [Serendipita vermifera]